MALKTLDTSWHCLGCLLELFLVPATHGLSFREVVAWCLYENQCDVQCQMDDIIMRHDRVCEELNGLMEAQRMATGAAQKWVKKEMDFRRCDLESLKACISYEESHLWEGSPKRDIPDDPPHGDAETKMSPNAGANDALSEDATAPVPGSPPSEDPAMEVNKGAVGLLPTSPVSRDNDELLTSNVAAGVEVGLMNGPIIYNRPFYRYTVNHHVMR